MCRWWSFRQLRQDAAPGSKQRSSLFLVGDLLKNCDLVRNTEALRADSGENSAANFFRQGLRCEDSRIFARKVSYKLSGDVCSRVSNRCGKAALFPDGVKRREQHVRTNGEVDVFLCAALDAANK